MNTGLCRAVGRTVPPPGHCLAPGKRPHAYDLHRPSLAQKIKNVLKCPYRPYCPYSPRFQARKTVSAPVAAFTRTRPPGRMPAMPTVRSSSYARAALLLLAMLLLTACASGATPASEPTAGPPTLVSPPLPALDAFDPASVAGIDLAGYPVIPEISANALAIYQAGLARGNNPGVFSKLGDCMTENPYFLVTFAEGDYDLGPYPELAGVLDHFSQAPARTADWDKNSFATIGLAAASGFNIAGPLDATWADPAWCKGGESPAACEYRWAQPSVAVIMFGTNDVSFTEPATYNYFLRTLVAETIDHGVLPLLNTFPTRPEDPEKSLLLNRIVVSVAEDYDIPLVNLNLALAPLPHQGVDPNDTIHLSVPADEQVDHFTEEHLQSGFTMRNLVTLQALEAVLKAVE